MFVVRLTPIRPQAIVGGHHFHGFVSAGSLTLGGNLSVALGPLGRNGEALGSLNTSGKLAAILALFHISTLFHKLIHIPLR